MRYTGDMSKEIWKDVPRREEEYQASNFGQIRKRQRNGGMKIVKQSLHPDGYYDVSDQILTKGRDYVHRVIATTFCPNDDTKHKVIVDHLDNNPKNNRADNLEWITQAENVRRAGRIGRTPKKTKCRCLETQKEFKSIAEASREYGIRYYSVYGSCETGKAIKGLHFERIEE